MSRKARAQELLDRGQEFFDKKFFRNAVAVFKKGLELDTENSELLNAYAATLLELDDESLDQEAIDCLLKAIRLEPANPRPWNNLGKFYYLRGDLSLAEDLMKKTLKLAPHSAVVHANLAAAYRLGNQYEQSLEILQQAIKINPRSPWLRFQLGLTYIFRAYHNRSKLDLEKAKAVFIFIKNEMKIEANELPAPAWKRMIDMFLATPMDTDSLLPLLYRYVPEHMPVLSQAPAARPAALGRQIH